MYEQKIKSFKVEANVETKRLTRAKFDIIEREQYEIKHFV